MGPVTRSELRKLQSTETTLAHKVYHGAGMVSHRLFKLTNIKDLLLNTNKIKGNYGVK